MPTSDGSDRRRRLDPERVANIRTRLAAGETHRAIAAAFGVSSATIQAIACGRNWRSARPERPCDVPGCAEVLRGNGKHSMCDRHVKQARRRGQLPGQRMCSQPACTNGAQVGDLCHKHNWRRERNGDPSVVTRRASGAGSTNRQHGYRVVHIGSATLYEHRLVMQEMLGRKLLPLEEVHHKNGQRTDNRPENLELWTRSQPAGGRVVDKVAWAKELLATYEPGALA